LVQVVFRLVLVAGLACLATYVFREWWLTSAAEFLIVSDQPRAADAIIVLGGGNGDRERTGARLYHDGFAQQLLTTGQTVDTLGFDGTFAELSAAQLEREGVPPGHIRLLATSDSTCDDARLSRELLTALGARSLIVVSDPFHMRRAMILFKREYAGADIELIPVAAAPSWFSTRQWWMREKDARVVVEEYFKLTYYLAAGCPRSD
jgi:uncharacterized SAM-binding protein YcdF (DUF218 family)